MQKYLPIWIRNIIFGWLCAWYSNVQWEMKVMYRYEEDNSLNIYQFRRKLSYPWQYYAWRISKQGSEVNTLKT